MAEVDPFEFEGVDALFDADLAEFVAARDALAKQLRQDGNREAAAAVKALRKPSTAAWGVNRVARAHGEAVEDLLRAGAAVRAAQIKAVQGSDDGSLRETTRAWRDQIQGLAAKVAKLIGEQYRDEAAASFEAGSVDEALADLLRRGRLTATITPAGFGLAGMPEPPDRPAREQPASKTTRPARAEPEPDAGADDGVDQAALAAAREELADRDKALERALHRLRRAEQRLEQAREAVDDATLAHDDARRERDKAERTLKTLES